jgi:hypothetical protein
VLAHTFAALVQSGSALQLQAAEPLGPAQLWWVPQAEPAFHAVQPLPWT